MREFVFDFCTLRYWIGIIIKLIEMYSFAADGCAICTVGFV